MLNTRLDTFSLENFEGPLDFLLSLIQKEEINIYDVSIHELTQQFLQKLAEWESQQVEKGAEFIGMASYLVWYKSKTLLPKHEEMALPQEEEEDPQFEIIHHLLDYCRFKQAAKELAQRQDKQSACFYRGTPALPDWKKPMGIQHLSLNDLADLFKEMMKRAGAPKPQIYEENWKVADKIKIIRLRTKEQDSFLLEDLFKPGQSRLEWIVIFLAILELMKIGEIRVGKQDQDILIFAKSAGEAWQEN